jgi:hypothetical protein
VLSFLHHLPLTLVAEIEAKFLALCPDAKPISVEEFIARAVPVEEDLLGENAENEDDYNEKQKQWLQKEKYESLLVCFFAFYFF